MEVCTAEIQSTRDNMLTAAQMDTEVCKFQLKCQYCTHKLYE